jgi:hypothetical protein
LLPFRPALKLAILDQTLDRPGDESLCSFGFAVAIRSGIDKILQVCLHLRIGAESQLLRGDPVPGSRHGRILPDIFPFVS